MDWVAGELLLSTEGGVNVPMERRRLGYMPQGFSLFPHLNVLDNVAYGLREVPGRLSKTEARQAARLVLERIDSAALGPRSPSTLSGGEQQRVAIARSMLNDPKLIIADEPTGNLDPETSSEIISLFKKLNSMGTSMIIATHDYNLILKLDGEVYKCEDGSIFEVKRK